MALKTPMPSFFCSASGNHHLVAVAEILSRHPETTIFDANQMLLQGRIVYTLYSFF